MPAVLKAALAALLLPTLVSATQGPTRIGPGELYPQVKQVVCDEGRGTAFNIGGGRFASVEHVTGMTNCAIDGKPIQAKSEGQYLDFSTIKLDQPSGFKVTCDGIKPWTWVFAVGYARGWKWQTMVMLLATPWKTSDGMQILIGPPTVIPGQSGGVAMPKTGEAAATINRYTPNGIISLVRPLRDTSLCPAEGRQNDEDLRDIPIPEAVRALAAQAIPVIERDSHA